MHDNDRELGHALVRLRQFEAALLVKLEQEQRKATDDELADYLTLCEDVQTKSERRSVLVLAAYDVPPDPSED